MSSATFAPKLIGLICLKLWAFRASKRCKRFSKPLSGLPWLWPVRSLIYSCMKESVWERFELKRRDGISQMKHKTTQRNSFCLWLVSWWASCWLVYLFSKRWFLEIYVVLFVFFWKCRWNQMCNSFLVHLRFLSYRSSFSEMIWKTPLLIQFNCQCVTRERSTSLRCGLICRYFDM